ncbi:MAG: sensor histidine kinase [Actinomycetia bacterium]|nr:sensor histidine kinase [Actinomycetes bacterium]
MRVATSSTTLRTRRGVHPTVAHTVDTLLLQERTDWAIHIHDGLTQSVTSAILELQGLQHRIRTEPELACATLKEIEDAIRNDLKQIRQILFELDGGTPHREPPLATFVSDLVDRWHLSARVSIEGEVERIPDVTLETANAIVAEALANAAKHSGVPEVSVRIIAGLVELRIEVEDRGSGVVPPTDDEMHFGLRLLRGRAERIGGTIEIDSKPGSGTRVVAVLPVGRRGDEG